MTTEELQLGKLSAALALYNCRTAGALVLRVYDGDRWRLQLYNAGGVPKELIFTLLELEPFVLVLLKELAMGRETLPL